MVWWLVDAQCRERWLNHLDPSLKKGEWSKEEDDILLRAQAKWGNSWTRIAELLPGRCVCHSVWGGGGGATWHPQGRPAD